MPPIAKITGAGVVASCGRGRADFWRGLCAHRTGRAAVDDPDLHAEVRDMHLVEDAPCLEHSAARYGVEAAREALAEAKAAGSRVTCGDLGLVVGTGMGEATSLDRARASTPTDKRMFETADLIADALGLSGPVLSTSNACAASAYAVGLALDILAAGEASAVLVTGAEAYSRVALAAFNRMLALDPAGARPFELERAGTLFGEGAGALVLEPESSSATALGSLITADFSCDADHITAPEQAGVQIRRILQTVVGQAAPRAAVPHATGTQLNDELEAAILHEVAGEDLPWLSIKDTIGHAGGASGILGIIAALAMLEAGERPEHGPHGPWLDTASTHLGERTTAVGPVVVSAYAFGGNNASLVIGGAA
ncbi:hypothetical protein HMPREF1531_00978 [Propionibacterium sp. oral taxon 192 str. F0372]|nr:hypothetical protein HMPREF1531_00978 [Propionibacterium sp. oral taxon 192 str. F0372]